MKQLILIITVYLLLIGCQPTNNPETVSPAATETAVLIEVTEVTPTLESDDSRIAIFPETTVVLRRVGPKKTEQWSFNEKGTVVYEGKEQWNDDRFLTLLSFVGTDWNSWEKRYQPVGVCADCYEYTLTRYQDGATDQVVVVETAILPNDLANLLNGLKEIINNRP